MMGMVVSRRSRSAPKEKRNAPSSRRMDHRAYTSSALWLTSVATAIIMTPTSSTYTNSADRDSLMKIFTRFRYRIFFAWPRLRSMAMYTVLKKVTTSDKISTRKYPAPSAISASGVPSSRKNDSAKGTSVPTTARLTITTMAYSVATRRRTVS